MNQAFIMHQCRRTTTIIMTNPPRSATRRPSMVSNGTMILTVLVGLLSIIQGCHGQSQQNSVYVPALVDTTSFDWAEELYNFTVSLINNHTDGWHDDDLFNDGTIVDWSVVDAACDATHAARAYWDLRSDEETIHGLVGCRCSSASTLVATISGLEGIPQVSPTSSASRLSDVDKFPYFSRLVAPGDHRGEVGAVVAFLRFMNFDHVTIITADTQYAKDLSTAFQSSWVGQHDDDSGIWEGTVADQPTIKLHSDGSIDKNSVKQAFDGIEQDHIASKSRVILLLSHDQQAYPILKQAVESDFQKDAIWVGISGWADRLPDKQEDDLSWMPEIPGYFGLTHYRNRDDHYQDFLERLQNWQIEQGRTPWKDLPDYAAENIVDSLLALVMALSQITNHNSRKNGTLVTDKLRQLKFDGISGKVRFTPEGDRYDPRYSVFNLQKTDKSKYGKDALAYTWVNVASGGTQVGSYEFNKGNGGIDSLCFAQFGCAVEAIPSDRYPVPKDKLSGGVVAAIVIIVLMLLAVSGKLYRTEVAKKKYKEQALKKVNDELLDLDKQVADAKKRQELLMLKRQELQEMPDTWTESLLTLVPVTETDEEYWTVHGKLRATMKDAHISKLWRIQNESLFTYFSFHKERLSMHGVDHNERRVWHGTSSLDPSVIYNDRQDGFMMQFAATGFWGRGIYFADKASYSHNYSHSPYGKSSVASTNERGTSTSDEREMFLTKLLVGNAVEMNRDESFTKEQECRDLIVPPVDPKTNQRYSTVTGKTQGSKVWIVYENGRAYPEYLVRYYRGNIDPNRTKYRNKKEAQAQVKLQGKAGDAEDTSTDSFDGINWEYKDDNGWETYSDDHQKILEKAYQAWQASKSTKDQHVEIETNQWKYSVDFKEMKQVNKEHASHTKRDVRRLDSV